jgi:anti-sigma factor RsiW
MSHPDALLAEYVDACERCREEVALARTARSTLASVAEVPAPGNLGEAAIAEAKRRAAGAPSAAPPSGKPGWYRWAGAAAGIAAALLLLTVVLPHVGTQPAREAAGGGGAPGAAPNPRPPPGKPKTG